MPGSDAIVVALALSAAVAAGLLAHEGAHALVLRAAGVAYDVVWFPGRGDGVVAALARPPWAAVHPRPYGGESPRVLRLAALAPLALAAPVLGPGLAGTFPVGHPVAVALAVGWLACAIPSPQDFSVAFYAERVLAAKAEGDSTRETAAPPSRAE